MNEIFDQLLSLDEQIAQLKEMRDSLALTVLAMYPAKEGEGQKSYKVDGYKVTTKNVINRRFNMETWPVMRERILNAFGPEALPVKESLDETKLKALRLTIDFEDSIIESQGKPQVKIEKV